MRITGGSMRGRNLKAPEGIDTRPTTDRVREALFNIIAHHDWGDWMDDPLDEAIVLDAFAGTGALGIEALSYGASFCCFFEKDRKALRALHENIDHLKLRDQIAILPTDVTKPPKAHRACSLIFLDPPYRKGLIPQALAILGTQGWIADHAMIICETDKNETRDLPATYELIFERAYGDSKICFYKAPIFDQTISEDR